VADKRVEEHVLPTSTDFRNSFELSANLSNLRTSVERVLLELGSSLLLVPAAKDEINDLVA